MALSINDLGPISLAVGIAVIILAVTSMVLANMQPNTYASSSVDNETFNATSDPFTYTVSKASDADFHQLTSVTCYESTSQSTEQTCTILDAELGEVNVSGTVDSDDESIDYDYEYEGAAFSTLGKGLDAMNTFADWFNILILVTVSAVILALVTMLKGSMGGRTGA